MKPKDRTSPWLLGRIEELQKSEHLLVEDNKVRRTRSKIQLLPGFWRGRVELERFFSPKLIAIGPIHHHRSLALGEQQKLILTSRYLKDTNQSPFDLLDTLSSHLIELRQQFSHDCFRAFSDGYMKRGFEGDDIIGEVLIWVLFLDGCSVLQLLDNPESREIRKVLELDQLVELYEDLLLFKNQIPFQVLKLLCKNQYQLNKCLDNFLQIHRIALSSRNTKYGSLQEHKVIFQEDQDEEGDPDPLHLLDHMRWAILRNGGDDVETKMGSKTISRRKYRIGSIRELRAAGIHVKKYDDHLAFHPKFVAGQGQLLLPEITVDGSTALKFLNLTAYEMCTDFDNDFEISSFVVFLSSLIEQPEDVKELRCAGVLRNELASDKEVADLFNKMDVILVPGTLRYDTIVKQVELYIESRRRKMKILGWIGEAYNTYFRSPWTIIALLAAMFGLALTFIQTWYAIHPKAS